MTTEPTKDDPFVFEGVKVWRDDAGWLRSHDPDYPELLHSLAEEAALRAFFATHPVDDDVFRRGGYEVRSLGSGGVAVAEMPRSWAFADRRAVENARGIPDVVAAALAFYDAQTPAPVRMSEPTQRFSVVTASARCCPERTEFVRFEPHFGRDPWVNDDGRWWRWSDLIDPEPYTPDGVK